MYISNKVKKSNYTISSKITEKVISTSTIAVGVSQVRSELLHVIYATDGCITHARTYSNQELFLFLKKTSKCITFFIVFLYGMNRLQFDNALQACHTANQDFFDDVCASQRSF